MRDTALLGPVGPPVPDGAHGQRAEPRPEHPAELPRYPAAVAPGHRPARPQADRPPGGDGRFGRPGTPVPERAGGGAGMRGSRPGTSGWPRSTPWPGLSACDAPELVEWCGQVRRCRSRRPRGRWSRTWRRRRWMPCSRPRTGRPPRAVGTMPCCCSCTTRAPGPTKRPRLASAT